MLSREGTWRRSCLSALVIMVVIVQMKSEREREAALYIDEMNNEGRGRGVSPQSRVEEGI